MFIQALRNAGAIIFVKTTMPVTGMALETVSHLFGRTTCGFNRRLVSGGSSGGEGALVGLHGSPMGVGTDVAGSTRIPCAFNSIYGIRPSTRRLSYDGVLTSRRGARGIAPAIGPMCHSVRDMELICKLATDAKPWQQDPLTIAMPWAPRPPVPSKLCIGLLKFDGVVMPHPPILRGLEQAAAKLRSAGHEVIEFAPYQHQRAWDIAVGRTVTQFHLFAHIENSSVCIILQARRRSSRILPPRRNPGSQLSRDYTPIPYYMI